MTEPNICSLQEMVGFYLESLINNPELHEGQTLVEDFRGWFVGWRDMAPSFNQEDPYDPQEAEDLLIKIVATLQSKWCGK